MIRILLREYMKFKYILAQNGNRVNEKLSPKVSQVRRKKEWELVKVPHGK